MSAIHAMDEVQDPLFTTVTLESFEPTDHSLRSIPLPVKQAPKRLNGLFSAI